jgi:hypothetical protein
LIQIKDRHLAPRINFSPFMTREVVMPFDAMLVSAAVVAMFGVLAAALLWGDLQTRPDRLKADANPQRPEAAGARPQADTPGRRAA